MIQSSHYMAQKEYETNKKRSQLMISQLVEISKEKKLLLG